MTNLPPDETDALTQAAVLALLLDLHPTPLTLAELVLEVADDPNDFGQRDEVERAVRDLAKSGLLHRYPTLRASTVFIFPTRAAVRFAELPLA